MIAALVPRLLASLLIAESLFSGVRVAGLLPRLAGYDEVAVALILARGLLGALQFMGGWVLALRRPQGFATRAMGVRRRRAAHAPRRRPGPRADECLPWLRWQVTAGYVVYAVGAAAYLRRRG